MNITRQLNSIKRKGGEAVAAKLSGKMVRIWSGEHGAYWREGGAGYSTGRDWRIPAWVLPFEEALACTRHCGPEKKIAFEVYVPRPETVDVQLARMKDQHTAAVARADAAEREVERLRGLLHRWLRVADRGLYRDRAHLSIGATPIADDTRAALTGSPAQ